MESRRLRRIIAKLIVLAGTLAENLEDILPENPAIHASRTYLLDEQTFDLIHTLLGVDHDVPYLGDATYSPTQAQERIRLLTELSVQLIALDKPSRPRFRSIAKALDLEIRFLKMSLAEDPTGVPGFDYTTYRALMAREQQRYQNVGRPRSPFTEMISRLKTAYDPVLKDDKMRALIDQRAKQLKPLFDKGKSLDSIRQMILAECNELKKENERQQELNREFQSDARRRELVVKLLSVFAQEKSDLLALEELKSMFGTRAAEQRWLAETNVLKAKYLRREFDRESYGEQLFEIYKRIIDESEDFARIFAMVHSMRRLKAFLNR